MRVLGGAGLAYGDFYVFHALPLPKILRLLVCRQSSPLAYQCGKAFVHLLPKHLMNTGDLVKFLIQLLYAIRIANSSREGGKQMYISTNKQLYISSFIH